MAYLKVYAEWDNCLSEASISFMPKQLQSLFVTILIFGQPAKPLDLWKKYKEVMGEDISQIFLWIIPCVMMRNKDVWWMKSFCVCKRSLKVWAHPLRCWPSKHQLGILCAEGTKNNIRGNVLCWKPGKYWQNKMSTAEYRLSTCTFSHNRGC